MSVMQQFVLANKSFDRSRMSMRQQLFRKALTRVDRHVEGYSKPRFLPDIRAAFLSGCMDLPWLKQEYDIDWLSDSPGQAAGCQKVGFGRGQKISELCVFDSDREQVIRRIMRVIGPGLI